MYKDMSEILEMIKRAKGFAISDQELSFLANIRISIARDPACLTSEQYTYLQDMCRVPTAKEVKIHSKDYESPRYKPWYLEG